MACTVPGCSSRVGAVTDDSVTISFHRFPTDPELKKTWEKNVGKGVKWRTSKHTRICSLHFEAPCFRDGYGRRTLHSNAIPTIFPNQPVSCQPVSAKRKYNYEKMDNYKLKLKNALHSTQLCGICLEKEDNMNTINEKLEIIIHQHARNTAFIDIIDVVFKDAGDILVSSLICNSCTDKLIQSYIFIENAKETSKIINNYVCDLYSKSDNICNHLSKSSPESSKVVIVLENRVHSYVDEEKEVKDISKNKAKTTVKAKSKINKSKKMIVPKRKCLKYKCFNCNIILPTHGIMKLHRVKCDKSKLLQCEVCSKSFRNEQYLNAHYKVHSKVKCKICHKLILDAELLEHFKTCHEDVLHRCSKCSDVFYSINALQTHVKISHATIHNNPQCLTCLKNFTEEELSLHKCKFSCPECSETPCIHHKYLMSYREQILNHAVKAKCLDCDYIFKKKEIMLGHVNREHLNHHPYSCDKCGQLFYSKVILKAHNHRYHEDYLMCQYCDSEFRNINNYESHVKSCEDIKRRCPCDDCPATFDSTEELIKHKKRRHSKDIFPCGLCNKIFLKDSKRKEHMVKVHSGLPIKNKAINVECVICQEKFDTKGELVQHMKSHGPNTTYPCRICNTEYETLRQFRAHNRKHNGPFAKCHICGKEMREVLLKKHLTTHTDATQTCETCGRWFQNVALLKYHQKIHFKSVSCPKCKKMINPARLRRHWKRHLIEENPALKEIKKRAPNLKCEQCDYITWNTTLLECHMNRYHLKIKPYVCHVCSKDFIGKHLLRKHIETHNINSVICMICLKSFANSACLKLHLRLHTGEKPFTCEICGDRFRTSSIMNVHKLKKHSNRSNTCPLCSNKFHTMRDLRRHVSAVHWKQENKRFDPRELKGLDKEHYHLFRDGRRVKVAEDDVDF